MRRKNPQVWTQWKSRPTEYAVFCRDRHQQKLIRHQQKLIRHQNNLLGIKQKPMLIPMRGRKEGRKGKERKGKERKGKERKGKERKGKERKGRKEGRKEGPPPTTPLICRRLTVINAPFAESSLLRASWGGLPPPPTPLLICRMPTELSAPAPLVESSLPRTSWGGLPPPPQPPR